MNRRFPAADAAGGGGFGVFTRATISQKFYIQKMLSGDQRFRFARRGRRTDAVYRRHCLRRHRAGQRDPRNIDRRRRSGSKTDRGAASLSVRGIRTDRSLTGGSAPCLRAVAGSRSGGRFSFGRIFANRNSFYVPAQYIAARSELERAADFFNSRKIAGVSTPRFS